MLDEPDQNLTRPLGAGIPGHAPRHIVVGEFERQQRAQERREARGAGRAQPPLDVSQVRVCPVADSRPVQQFEDGRPPGEVGDGAVDWVGDRREHAYSLRPGAPAEMVD